MKRSLPLKGRSRKPCLKLAVQVLSRRISTRKNSKLLHSNEIIITMGRFECVREFLIFAEEDDNFSLSWFKMLLTAKERSLL